MIDYGEGTVTYAIVPFESETLTGYELLRESGLSLVSIPFGGLGQGICSIEEVGCSVGSCRRLCQSSDPNSPFWQYFSLEDDGTWQSRPRGASGTSVEPGTIHGWAWTGTEPALPSVTFEEISRLAGSGNGSGAARHLTYDAAGVVSQKDVDRPQFITYVIAGAIVLVLLAGIFVAQRRRAMQEPMP
ncbi:MAG: hypothetical protein AB7V46_07230 [Thermomicrobiales bacterium]